MYPPRSQGCWYSLLITTSSVTNESSYTQILVSALPSMKTRFKLIWVSRLWFFSSGYYTVLHICMAICISSHALLSPFGSPQSHTSISSLSILCVSLTVPNTATISPQLPSSRNSRNSSHNSSSLSLCDRCFKLGTNMNPAVCIFSISLMSFSAGPYKV